jgi:hypothetical protein
MNFLIEQFGKRPEFKEIFDVLSRLVTDIEQLQKQSEGNTVGTRCKEILNEMLPSLLNKYISSQAMLITFSSKKEQSKNQKELCEKLDKLQKEINWLKAENIALTKKQNENNNSGAKNIFVELMPQVQTEAAQAIDYLQKNVFKKTPEIKVQQEIQSQSLKKRNIMTFTITSAILMTAFFGVFQLVMKNSETMRTYGEPVMETRIPQTPSVLTLKDTPDYQAPSYATHWADEHAPITAKPEDTNNYLAQKAVYETQVIKSYMHSSYGMSDYSNYRDAINDKNRQETHDILNADKYLKQQGINFALSVPSQSPHMYVITVKPTAQTCSLIENALIEKEEISANNHYCDNNQPIEIIEQTQQDKANEKSDHRAEVAGKATGLGLKLLIDLL